MSFIQSVDPNEGQDEEERDNQPQEDQHEREQHSLCGRTSWHQNRVNAQSGQSVRQIQNLQRAHKIINGQVTCVQESILILATDKYNESTED